jgi:hypothetical protein
MNAFLERKTLGGIMNRICKCLLVAADIIGAVSARAGDFAPTLQQIERAVRPAMAELSPAPAFVADTDNGILTIEYETRKFMVHNASMTGEWSTEAHEETGPKATGFLLKIYLVNPDEVLQQVTPQTLHQPYWESFLDETPLKGSAKEMSWNLSYGTRTDPALLEKLKQALASLGPADRSKAVQVSQGFNPPAVPVAKPADKADCSMNFNGIPIIQLVETYEYWAQQKVTPPASGWPNVAMRVITDGQVTRKVALQMIEDAFKEQAHVTIQHAADGSLSAVTD